MIAQKDSFRHQGMRAQMIAVLRKKGIQDEQVLQAMTEVPRHFFLDGAFDEWAYEDQAFSIGHGQTISQPYTVAFMTELLSVRKHDKILEIGTGSGYQAAVLAAMGGRVYTVERQDALYRKAKTLFASKQFGTVKVFLRDGNKGLPEYAPFNRIIVTAGAPDFPEALFEQLSAGGIMVVPVDSDGGQTMWRIFKNEDGSLTKEAHGFFRFVPFLPGLSK